MMYSGLPAKRLRSSGSCVATPTGQEFSWHLRIMTQPEADQHGRRKAELLGPEQRADHDITPGLQLAVDLDSYPAAQLVQHERLLGFGQAELPRQPGVLDAGQRRGPGAAVMPRNEDDIGVRLGDTRRDRPDPDFGDELDRNARLRIRIPEVVDQLREIFDRIDVVRRRREISVTFGIECRSLAMNLSTLCPGSCPPSPGLAP